MSDHPEQEDRDTLPPDAGVPSDLIPQPRGSLLQPNPNSYADVVLSDLLQASRRLEAERRALDLPKLLATQANDIKRHIDANYELVRLEVVSLRQQVEAQSAQCNANAAGLDEVRRELVELRARMEKLEMIVNAAGIST